MSPARQHRDRFASAQARPTPIVAGEGGGHQPLPPTTALTPAREHRLAQALAAPPAEQNGAPRPADTVDPVAAAVLLRLQHDKRRLKEIKSIEAKVAAKRDMLPHYRPWCDALIAAGRPAGEGLAIEVLPTIMVWSIDTGDWSRALELAGYVVGFGVPLPGHYKRDAESLIVEEVADAAAREQGRGHAFPLDVLEEVDVLTAHADMHDEVRAKLAKAIGVELARGAETAEGSAARKLIVDAIALLKRAHELNDRVGVKDRVKRLEKALAENLAALPPPAPEDGTTDTAGSTG